ncbi:YceI family protein [Streptomyces sp. WMMC500]|uniref:YceI family protein n=1 Tax=Streptomyces sp. WMMC500 TaxID=3015154 RepID=UPI00248CF71F|nr:YceI family protein [Streptomyces sp. WMMC500]WBB59232.1 YceI family protein [Streptomyces sp. WMMC500]
MTIPADRIPAYETGTWTIDPVHSDVSFVVRHLGVSKVRGTFDEVEGTIVTHEDPLQSEVKAVIKTASVNTRNETRDNHVRTADFLDVETHPEMIFTSTGIREKEGVYLIDGDLSLRGVTRPVTLETEVGGFAPGPGDSTVVGFSASTEISRSDFGVTGGPAGATVSDAIKITLDIEAGRS